MSETDFAAFEAKGPRDRTVMNVLYALHTLSWASMYTLALVALVVNYVKRADEVDPLYAAHHSYMIATFWWTVLWAIPAGILTGLMWLTILLIPLSWLPLTMVGLWYLYRCVKGWMRFSDNRLPT